MKRKFISLTLICVLLISLCGCIRERPKYLPGKNEGDSQFVWVCKKPFAFFCPTYNYEDYWKTRNEYNKENGYPIEEPIACGVFEGVLKGCIEKEGEFIRFYSGFFYYDQTTYFYEEKNWGNPSKNENFSGHAYYYKNYFELVIGYDPENFFDSERPELRFDKMTKEDFLKSYGDVEGISKHLSDLGIHDFNKLPSDKKTQNQVGKKLL